MDYTKNKKNVDRLARKIQKLNPGYNVWVEKTFIGNQQPFSMLYVIRSDIGFEGIKKVKITK